MVYRSGAGTYSVFWPLRAGKCPQIACLQIGPRHYAEGQRKRKGENRKEFKECRSSGGGARRAAIFGGARLPNNQLIQPRVNRENTKVDVRGLWTCRAVAHDRPTARRV